MKKLFTICYLFIFLYLTGCSLAPLTTSINNNIPLVLIEDDINSTLTVKIPITLKGNSTEGAYNAIHAEEVWIKNGIYCTEACSNGWKEKEPASCKPLKWNAKPTEELLPVPNSKTNYIWEKTIHNWIPCGGKHSAKKCSRDLEIDINPSVEAETICNGPIATYSDHSEMPTYGGNSIVDLTARKLTWKYFTDWLDPLVIDFTSFKIPLKGHIESDFNSTYKLICKNGICNVLNSTRSFYRSENIHPQKIILNLITKGHLTQTQKKEAKKKVRIAKRKKEQAYRKDLQRAYDAISNRNNSEVQQCQYKMKTGNWDRKCDRIFATNTVVNAYLNQCSSYPSSCQ